MENKKFKFYSFKNLPHDMARIVCLPLLAVFRMKRYNVDGTKYKTKFSGPAVITANHTGFSDPFIVSVCFWYRRVHFWASEEVMGTPLRSFLLKGTGCIKVNRKIMDIKAIRDTVKVLKNMGRMLVVFPQGQISKDENLDNLKSGAVLLALQSGAPILPVYVSPNNRLFRRSTIVIGNPINCSEYCKSIMPSMEDIKVITKKMQDEMNICANTYKNLTKGD